MMQTPAQSLNASSARLRCIVNCGLRRIKTNSGKNKLYKKWGVPPKSFRITSLGHHSTEQVGERAL